MAGLLTFAAFVATTVGFLAHGMRCDDRCADTDLANYGWGSDASAVEWDIQLLLVGGAFAAALIALFLSHRRRYVLAAISSSVTLALGVAWANLLHAGHWGGF